MIIRGYLGWVNKVGVLADKFDVPEKGLKENDSIYRYANI